MNQPSDELNSIFQQFEAIRARLQGEIAKLARELEGTGRRNEPAIAAASAMIETVLRDYQVFMARMNAVRVEEEAQADTADDLLNKRREWGTITARTNLFRGELNQWYEVKSLVRHQIKIKRQKLYADEGKLPPTRTAQLSASDDVMKWLHAFINPSPQTENAMEYGCFPDIGLSNAEFHTHMHAAYRICLAKRQPGPIRFLDVGCGSGLKVLSALRYFDQAYGMDLDPAYVEVARRLLSMDFAANATVREQDALAFDGYGHFDVIYFYRPMADEQMMMDLERKIVGSARPGTILVAPYVGFSGRHEDLGCGRVAGSVYLAGTSKTAADAWRRKAERTGPYIIKAQTKAPRSIWAPLFEVSHANGFDLPRLYERPVY